MNSLKYYSNLDSKSNSKLSNYISYGNKYAKTFCFFTSYVLSGYFLTFITLIKQSGKSLLTVKISIFYFLKKSLKSLIVYYRLDAIYKIKLVFKFLT